MTPEEFYQILKPVQEEKNFYFHTDHDWVLNILKGVLLNKERYGYGSCPCRLATRDPERDQAIICPCQFRDEDVERYGRCYCLLYVSCDVAQGKQNPPEVIPERWVTG